VPQPATGFTGDQLSLLYRERFTPEELAFKEAMWRVFCESFFQKYVGRDDTVVDLAAGTCEFINAIDCGEKIAVDLNPDVEQHIKGGKAMVASSSDMSPIADNSIDVVFTSNFFEHLPNKNELVATLNECHRILREDGKLLVVMPNIRYLPGRYWDYFDHHLALTHYSLVEALWLTGFEPEKVIPKFLPYTLKYSKVPKTLIFVKLYMKMRFVWPFIGKQMFVSARRVPVELPDSQ
jgi:SAM-dependent methyltransferase